MARVRMLWVAAVAVFMAAEFACARVPTSHTHKNNHFPGGAVNVRLYTGPDINLQPWANLMAGVPMLSLHVAGDTAANSFRPICLPGQVPFGINEASTVCRALGRPGAADVFAHPLDEDVTGNPEAFLGPLHCPPAATQLSQCLFGLQPSSCKWVAGIVCKESLFAADKGGTVLISAFVDRPQAGAAADLDGDGDLDVVSGTCQVPTSAVYWHENLDGLGTFGPAIHLMTSKCIRDIAVGDLDEDGDVDIVVASMINNTVSWLENGPGGTGLGNFSQVHIISVEVHSALGVELADLDGDGTLEVVSASADSNSVMVHKMLDSTARTWAAPIILGPSSLSAYPSGLAVGDLDNDGFKDIVVGCEDSGNILLIRQTAPLVFATPTVITASRYALSLALYDLDLDGDLDVAAATSSGLYIYYNTGGTFVPLALSSVLHRAVAVGDIDGDGRMDVVGSENDLWLTAYRNAGTTVLASSAVRFEGTSFRPTFGTNWVTVADVNKDGKNDVVYVGAQEDRVAWVPNTGTGLMLTAIAPMPAFSAVPSTATGVASVASADLTGGGFPELVVATQSGVRYFVNNHGSFDSEVVVGADAAVFVTLADIDSDGDQDILACLTNNKVVWFEHLDGMGQFDAAFSVISDATVGPRWLDVGDIDGDGLLDVVIASFTDNRVSWVKNLGGGLFATTIQIITSGAPGAVSAILADLDDDGDLDVVFAAQRINKLAWHENVDGVFSAVPRVISDLLEFPTAACVADFDGDGTLDVVGASRQDFRVWLFRNHRGTGTFDWPEIELAQSIAWPSAVNAVDIDGDGDFDLVATGQGDGKVVYFENIDGRGNMSQPITLTLSTVGPMAIVDIDIDQDGDRDLAVASTANSKLVVFHNLLVAPPASPVEQCSLHQADGSCTACNQGFSMVASDESCEACEPQAGCVFAGCFTYQDTCLAKQPLHWTHITLIHDTTPARPGALVAGDMDMDGWVDFVGLASGQVYLARNLQGVFSVSVILAVKPAASRGVGDITAINTGTMELGDMDQDGDLDVVIICLVNETTILSVRVVWIEQANGAFANFHVIKAAAISGGTRVTVGKVDDDNTNDIVVSSGNADKVYLLRNTDGLGNFPTEATVVVTGDNPSALKIVDVNNDGKPDVLVALYNERSVLWSENLGNGVFDQTRKTVLASDVGGPRNFDAQDVNGDGFVDILGGSDDNRVYVYLSSGLNTYTRTLISDNADRVLVMQFADLDGDGDFDIIYGTSAHDFIAWAENLDGQGTFPPANSPISFVASAVDGPQAAAVFDVDKDGDLDMVSTAFFLNLVYLFRNEMQVINTAPTISNCKPEMTFLKPANSSRARVVLGMVAQSNMLSEIVSVEVKIVSSSVDLAVACPMCKATYDEVPAELFLTPGNYTFQVKAFNRRGKPDERSTTCTTVITIPGKCINKRGKPCCFSNSKCNDSRLCTTDTCNMETNICSNKPVPNCCRLDSDCNDNDNDPCTTTSCNIATRQCVNTTLPNCP